MTQLRENTHIPIISDKQIAMDGLEQELKGILLLYIDKRYIPFVLKWRNMLYKVLRAYHKKVAELDKVR
jgi:hypothetical protein